MPVSVALCTCNGQAFLEQQLESIAAQGYAPLELVICDDASSDRSVALIRAFAQRHPEIDVRLQCNPVRLGSTANFEQAISLCRGDVIFMSDQDDLWLPGKVSRLLGEIAAGADLAFSNAEVVDAQGQPLGYRLWDSLWFTAAEQAKVHRGRAIEVFLKHVVAAGGTLAFRASLRELAMPIPDLRVAHDAWVALMAAAVGQVRIVPESLIQYRLHDNNQVGLRKLSFRQQIEQARRQIDSDAFAYAADLHSQALQRLHHSQGHAVAPQILRRLEEKVLHSRRRHSLDQSLGNRIRTLLTETLSLRYFSYSYGWKSIAQDLFLR